jgi:outer membrane lipoprotein carrier protein
VTCINGNIFQTKKFSFKFLETEKNKAVEMTPSNAGMKNFVDKIILYFDADFSVAKAEMLEPSKNSTVIVFKNKKLNAEIPDKLFILN